MLKTKRIYDKPSKADGYRILVDRLWPRGIKKEKAHIDKWLKDIAPSNDLRKWFNHEPEKWKQFISKYAKEIKGSAALLELKEDITKHKTVTLLFGAKDQEHNQAIALKEILNK
jgi:uncharacterized protein YeaO (DUF488 family)